MSSEINLQADVGQLTLQGLSAFNTLLATLTADDVNPMAMIQMENLGAAFPINGKYAAKVPDMLQRCSSSRLDRLGLVVGWRKGDAASLMAKSAGGQAIALLATALMGISGDRGDVFFGLSRKLLPASIALSSISQLEDVARLLSKKLAPLGSGNLVAEQVSLIHDVYTQLQKPVPTDLLEVMSTESAVDLLYAVSRALREDGALVRISGTQAMGYIYSLVTMMFPHDCLVTVDNFVVFEGENRKVLVEFETASAERPTEIKIETILRISHAVPLPIVIEPRERKVLECAGHFTWEGFLADQLQLNLLDHGIKCTEELRVAIAGVLVLIPAELKGMAMFPESHPLPRSGLVSLLGDHPNYRISQVCQTILRIPPTERPQNIEEALAQLMHVFQSDTKSRVSCSCGLILNKCNPLQGWPDLRYRDKEEDCRLRHIWNIVGRALDKALVALFVEAGINATVWGNGWKWYGTRLATQFLTYKYSQDTFDASCQKIHSEIMSLAGYISETKDRVIGQLACSDSSTIYSGVLRTMSITPDRGVLYYLVDGRLQLNGRYHSSLRTLPVPERPKATRSLYMHKGVVKPSSFGEHLDLLLTVHERSAFLELTCAVRFSGNTVRLQLARVLIASYGLEESEPCEHSPTEELSADRMENIMTTSVAAPRAQEKKIAIVQTAGNATAQLLSCELAVPTIIQRRSCLNCTYDEADGKFKMIIVG
ncbi:hypothetical protein ASPCAL01640 [Aspergillus calidoustus]|uniref:Uncharacterized protein n=1 Tax=Aspergillus calidoustus TaxID=454130 RepID=A0A0U5FRB8_ASPCI|nr:hypothetical protein ASPCAL01640 [Aspergillus calidoustus]